MERNNENLNTPDCLQCRLVGGICFTLCGLYLIYQKSTITNKTQRRILSFLAYGLFGLGALRAANLPPFKPLRMPNHVD